MLAKLAVLICTLALTMSILVEGQTFFTGATGATVSQPASPGDPPPGTS